MISTRKQFVTIIKLLNGPIRDKARVRSKNQIVKKYHNK